MIFRSYLKSIHFHFALIGDLKKHKRKMIKNNLLFVLFFLSIAFADLRAQQLPQYGQYMFNPFAINPAFAGSRQVRTLLLQHRSQWINLDGAPVTNNLAFHTPLKSGKVALGLQLMNDRVGPHQTQGFLFTYTYRIRFAKSSLAAAIRFGGYQRTIQANKITYPEAGAESIWNNYNMNSPNADAGIYYNSDKEYIGFSVNQLFTKNYSSSGQLLYTTQPHFNVMLGKAFQLSNSVIFNPSVLVKSVSGINNIDINLNFFIDEKIWLGVFVRTDYGVGSIIYVPIKQKLKLGFSRDWALSSMGGYKSGRRTNEFIIQYDFSTKHTKSISPKYL